MVDASALVPFFIALLALQLSPGPDMMLIIGRGIGQGRRTAFLTAIGATLLAGAVQLPLLALGLASLIQASPVAFNVLRWAGAAYLGWLGTRLLLQSRKSTDAPVSRVPITAGRALREGMISNLTNPKALVFMLAFLPQFVNPHGTLPIAIQLLLLGTLQKLSGFAVLAGIAAGAGGMGDWTSLRPRLIVWQQRFTGLVMLALGIHLLLVSDAHLSISGDRAP